MIKIFRKIFIKNYNNIENSKVREAHGKLASVFGIVSNVILFSFKLIIGIISGSISIIADGINNLSDMGSSIINLICFKLSGMPADDEHPYGHERIEYIAGLIISIIIIMVGGHFLYQSVMKIFNVSATTINLLTIIVLVVSILIKVWQMIFNYKIAKLINSVALEATASDSRNDIITTTVILIGSIITYLYPNIIIDGYLGVFVSLFILIAGIKLIKDTTNPLIGISVDHEFVKKVIDTIKNYDEIVIGIHDPVCHIYGPTTKFMSIHVEVPADVSIIKSHEIIDNIEHDIKKTFGVELVIHMDPVDTKCELMAYLKDKIVNKVFEISPLLSIHDFRIVTGYTNKNIIFDMVLPYKTNIKKDEIYNELLAILKLENENYNLIINFENSYVKE